MKKKRNVPALRFREFEGEWEEKKLSEIFSERSERGYQDRDLLSVTIDKGVIKRSDIKSKDNSSKDKSKYKCVLASDIVYNSMRMWQGASGVSQYDGIVSPAYTVLKGIDYNSSIFFGYYFKTVKMINIFQRNSQGLTSDTWNLKYSKLSIIKINSTTLPEQTKIAAFLTSVDDRIQQLTRKKELLEQYKKGVMQKIFSRKIRFRPGPFDSAQAPEITHSNKVKDAGIPYAAYSVVERSRNYPDWEERKLGDVCSISKGKGISKDDISENGSLECIIYGELYTHYGEVIYKVYSKTDAIKSDLILSEANDVIIPASGETQIDIAKASCVTKEGVALGGDLNIIKSKLNGIYLSYYLNNKSKLDIARIAQGISVVHLYSSQLKLLKINVPSLPEQQKIASFLTAIDRKIDLVNTQLEKTMSWKKGLLQKMFV